MAHGLNRTLCLLWSIKFYWHTACLLVHHSPGCSHVTVAETTWPEKPKMYPLWPFRENVLTPGLDSFMLPESGVGLKF